MDIAKASGDMISIGDAFKTAALGYMIVFAGMILLILVIIFASRIINKQAKKAAGAKQEAAPVQIQMPTPEPAPGSAGEVKLNNVSERDAAMIMAIVANQLGKPLNELRFISIKEVDPE